MKKTILVVASCDTKINEISYVKEFITRSGHQCIILDISTGFDEPQGSDISRYEVIHTCGYKWEIFVDLTKAEKLKIITQGASKIVSSLYSKNQFDGIFSLGGVQNTTVAVAAMKQLPIGVPKVVVSTVVSGNRTFDPLVGTKDIVLIPSIADIAGVNTITRNVLSNASAAIVGMAERAGLPLKKGKELLVGTTLMGVTNGGVCCAIECLKELNIETVGFHATGVGGRAMEELIEGGILNAVMDLTLHEITSEYFGGGFSFGAENRLSYLQNRDIPAVISLGGLDFIDFSAKALPEDMDQRKYMMHNPQIAHIKVLKHEGIEIGKIVAERLNKAKGKVSLLIPMNGLRADTEPGDPLYDKEVDDAIIKTIVDNIDLHITVKTVEANFNDKAFGIAAADEMVRLLKMI